MKTIIIVPNKEDYIFNLFDENISVYNLYKYSSNFFYKILRKLLYLSGFKLNNLFYEKWINYLGKKVKIIFFDSCRIDHRLLNVLKKRENIYIYYWNPVFNLRLLNKQKEYFKVYSFDKGDSKKYKLKFNAQFYPLRYAQSVKSNEIKYDFMLVCADKGRAQSINNFYKLVNGCRNYIYIFCKKKSGGFYHKEKIRYSDYLNILNSSLCIVEIMQKNQSGLTLRSIEALFYNKKLITNNNTIKEEKFYNSANIYILNKETNKEDINKFMKKPVVNIDDEIKKYFNIDKWIERFD